MSRRCSTFQLFACHHKHVSIFFATTSRVEDASCVCSQRPPSETQDLSRCLHLLFRCARFRYQSCRLSVTYVCVLCEAPLHLNVLSCLCGVCGWCVGGNSIYPHECSIMLSVCRLDDSRCACQVPQEPCMCWKYAPSNKYAACVELDIRPNSLRSLI